MRQNRQRLDEPSVDRRQLDRRLGTQSRSGVCLEAVQVVQHGSQGDRDPGAGPGVWHQHDPAGPCLLGRDCEIQSDPQPEDPDDGLHPGLGRQDEDERRDQEAGGYGSHAAVFAWWRHRFVHDEGRFDRRHRPDDRFDQGSRSAGRRGRPLAQHAHKPARRRRSIPTST